MALQDIEDFIALIANSNSRSIPTKTELNIVALRCRELKSLLYQAKYALQTIETKNDIQASALNALINVLK